MDNIEVKDNVDYLIEKVDKHNEQREESAKKTDEHNAKEFVKDLVNIYGEITLKKVPPTKKRSFFYFK